MKLFTVSGNAYWYDYKSNKIEEYAGQKESALPCVHYIDVPEFKNLPELEHFIIEITRDCNLRCSYCCYSGQYARHRVHESRSMNNDMIDDVITFINTVRNSNKQLTISLYGGEPLIYPDIVRYTINKCRGFFPTNTTYTISTNGVLMNEDVLSYCVENSITLNISLDGIPSLHDKNRRDKAGYPTFAIVHQRLESIWYKYPYYWENNVRLFVTVESLSQLKDIAFYWGKDEVLKRKEPTAVSTIAPNYDSKSYHAIKPVGNECDSMIELLDYYEKNRDNRFCEGFFERFISDVFNRPVFDIPAAIYPLVCLPNNYRCFIDVNGNIGICEKVCDELRFGNIYTGIDMNAVNSIVSEHASIKKKRCENCWAFRLCRTCYTNYGYSERAWKEDCANSRASAKLQLFVMLEMAERKMLWEEGTKSIQLRELIPGDIDSIKRIMTREKVIKEMKYLSYCQTMDGASLLYETLTEREPSDSEFAIMRGITIGKGKLVGIVGVDSIEDGKGNLFFFLDDEYWGRGIMTYAMSMFLAQHLRKGIGVYARISKNNSRALKMVSKFSVITVMIEDI